MKPTLILFIATLFSMNVFSQAGINTNKAIQEVLTKQQNAWNNADLVAFMDGYWKNDSLKFIGKNGIKYGWQVTLDNYKKSYPDKATMGKLNFEILTTDVLSNSSAMVIGKWNLTRDIGNVGGYFTLLFKRIDNKWVIVCDHTS